MIDVWLIHGLGDSPRVWRAVRKDPAFKRYRLIAPALPGFGGTTPLEARRRGLRGLADWLAAQIKRRSRGRRVVLVGHSMGGVIATLVASGQSRITGFINIEGPLLLADCDTTREASRAADFSAWFKAFRKAVRSPESGAPAHYAAGVDETAPAMFLRGAQDIVAFARRARSADLYAASPTPRIYYYGGAPGSISKESKHFLATRRLASERFAKAGHWPMTETPAEFAAALARSLRQLCG